jgi:hypothetical protein
MKGQLSIFIKEIAQKYKFYEMNTLYKYKYLYHDRTNNKFKVANSIDYIVGYLRRKNKLLKQFDKCITEQIIFNNIVYVDGIIYITKGDRFIDIDDKRYLNIKSLSSYELIKGKYKNGKYN